MKFDGLLCRNFSMSSVAFKINETMFRSAGFFVFFFLSGELVLFPVLIVARKKPLPVVGYCRGALANSESDFDFETPELLHT